MLPELHDTLRRLLYERGGIHPLDVGISFEAPTREWYDRLTRPTINLFLLNIEENTKLRNNQYETTKSNGRAERRRPPRRVDLQYMISALSTEIEDEHALLWRVMATLMTYPDLPREILPNELGNFDLPLTTRLAQPEDRLNVIEIWGGLGMEPHSALSYIVTLPLDVSIPTYSPLVLTRTVRTRNMRDPETDLDARIGIAGVVRDKDGEPLADVMVSIDGSADGGSMSDDEGRFRLHRAHSGSMTLHAQRDGKSKTVEVQVPSDSYDITLD
jgi:hypothetical protein